MVENSADIERHFAAHHIILKREWLQEALHYVSSVGKSRDQLADLVYQQWLFTDLKYSTEPVRGLQRMVADCSTASTFLPGPSVFQVHSVRDIGQPNLLQYKRLQDPDYEEPSELDDLHYQQNPNNRKNGGANCSCLCLQLSDGAVKLKAFEKKRVPGLGLSKTLPGCKLLIHGRAELRRGHLLLTGANCQPLYGAVEQLMRDTQPPGRALCELLGRPLPKGPLPPAAQQKQRHAAPPAAVVAAQPKVQQPTAAAAFRAPLQRITNGNSTVPQQMVAPLQKTQQPQQTQQNQVKPPSEQPLVAMAQPQQKQQYDFNSPLIQYPTIPAFEPQQPLERVAPPPNPIPPQQIPRILPQPQQPQQDVQQPLLASMPKEATQQQQRNSTAGIPIQQQSQQSPVFRAPLQQIPNGSPSAAAAALSSSTPRPPRCSSAATGADDDDAELFGRRVANFLRKLPPRQGRRACIEFEKLMLGFEEANGEGADNQNQQSDQETMVCVE